MTRFSKILLISTVVFLALWQLPWLYRFMSPKAQSTPFTLYSCMIGDFVMADRDDKGTFYTDRSGNRYSLNEYDELVPTFFVRQLIADSRFPKIIQGEEVDAKQVSRENFIFRSSSSELNSPKIGLYPLMESMSGRVNLELPNDVFRINSGGIEFIDIATNSINTTKSQKFNEAFRNKGFKFPARSIAGNPSTKKEYDNGYLIVDNEGALFHLKMTVGQPYIRKIELPDNINIAQLFVTEYTNRKMLALLTTADHSFYALHGGTYSLHKIATPPFNPRSDNMTIIGNMFDWTVAINDKYYAINARDYSLISEISHPHDEPDMLQKIGRYLFPVSISFTGSKDKYVMPRIVGDK